ncbi:hypothetical protein ACWDE0_22735 [Streptomyces sp. 900105755]
MLGNGVVDGEGEVAENAREVLHADVPNAVQDMRDDGRDWEIFFSR